MDAETEKTKKLHPAHLSVVKEMFERDSDIVEFPIEKGPWKRVRLEHWPRTQGLTPKAFRALKEGGYIRSRNLHPHSRSFPRWTLTILGIRTAQGK